MSARFGEGLAAAILLRMKRKADDTAARAAPEPEAVAGPVRRHHRCGRPFGSIGCRNTCGDGAA